MSEVLDETAIKAYHKELVDATKEGTTVTVSIVWRYARRGALVEAGEWNEWVDDAVGVDDDGTLLICFADHQEPTAAGHVTLHNFPQKRLDYKSVKATIKKDSGMPTKRVTVTTTAGPAAKQQRREEIITFKEAFSSMTDELKGEGQKLELCP